MTEVHHGDEGGPRPRSAPSDNAAQVSKVRGGVKRAMCVESSAYNLIDDPPTDAPLAGLQSTREQPLCIWHDGADANSRGVNGVNATIWLLARYQARLGHRVTLLLRVAPSAAALSSARALGIELAFLGGGTWSVNKRGLASQIETGRPDIVHMHSVFIPRQASLARQLHAARVPYITTPHGGLSAEVLRQNPVRKGMYARLIERPRCLSSAMLTASIGEEADLHAFLGEGTPIRNMPVGIDTQSLGDARWNRQFSPPRLVFLGRFDVHVKGIDLLLGVAGLMRDHEFHLYGVPDQATREMLRQLRCGCGPNVFFHPPVYGPEKVKVLCDATMYLQMSRSESFGISIAEAMYLGVPCAVSDQIHIATAFRRSDLGLLLPAESAAAAMLLTRTIQSRDQLVRWSERARTFARENFDAASAAKRHVDLYRQIVAATTPKLKITSERRADAKMVLKY